MPIVVGIDPVKRLLPNDRNCKFVKKPICVGNVPPIAFDQKSMKVKALRAPIVVGIDPPPSPLLDRVKAVTRSAPDLTAHVTLNQESEQG